MPLWKFYDPFRVYTGNPPDVESLEAVSLAPVYLNVDKYEAYNFSKFFFAARKTAYDLAEIGFSANNLARDFAELLLNAGELSNATPQPVRIIRHIDDVCKVVSASWGEVSASQIRGFIINGGVFGGYLGAISAYEIQGVLLNDDENTRFYDIVSIHFCEGVEKEYVFESKTRTYFAKMHLSALPEFYFLPRNSPSGNIFTRISVVSGEVS